MLALLPVIALAALYWFCRARGEGWLRAGLFALLLAATLAAFGTELLSLGKLVTRGGVAAFWLVSAGAAVFATLRGPTEADASRGLRASWRSLGLGERGLVGGGALIVTALAVVAVRVPPNTWDALVYHVPRLMHWAQQANIDHFPTNIARQLHMPPFASWAMLHLHLLVGGDRLLPTVCWLSVAGAVLTAAHLARQLDGCRRAQILAALACLAIPMLLLKAASSVSDPVVGTFLMLMLGCGLAWSGREGGAPALDRDVLASGAALGLALLSKGNAYMFAPPLLLWIAIRAWSRWRWRAVAPLIVMGSVALALNVGHWSRNLALAGSPLGPSTLTWHGRTFSYGNDRHSLGTLLSNSTRLAALELATGSDGVNEKLVSVVDRLEGALGLDPEDLATTWGHRPFRLPTTWNDETDAGSPHWWLLLAAGIVVLAFGRRPAKASLGGSGGAWVLFGTTVAGLLLFAWAVRWEPTENRLLLPLQMLVAPLIGLAAARLPARWCSLVGGALLLSCVPYVVFDNAHPWLGRSSIWTTPRVEQAFAPYAETTRGFRAVAARVAKSGCQKVDLVADGNDLEYLWWTALAAAGWHGEIRNVEVWSYSGPLLERQPWRDFAPCARVSIVENHARLIWVHAGRPEAAVPPVPGPPP